MQRKKQEFKKELIKELKEVSNELLNKSIIKGNKITMKGVEHKVLGVDDRGYSRIMYPGFDYTFPGAKYVIEKPLKNE